MMKNMVYRCFKRTCDLVLALLLSVAICPFFLLLCFLVRVNMGSPIFFKQVRSGKNRKQFVLVKFRTMTDQKDENMELLPDDKRQTRFGNFLRSSSLDELPELWSIIKGDMSIIGPRPLPPNYDNFFSDRELLRFEVRGGLLPPDSVEESAYISWDKQLEYEAAYAEKLSLKNDIKILLSAIRIIFRRNKTDYGSYVRLSLSEERAAWNIQTK